MKATKKLSQVALGDLLDVTQQQVALLMNRTDAGFSYTAATLLVRSLGFAGVDAFFAAKGISIPGGAELRQAS